jgi:hypothetical protein
MTSCIGEQYDVLGIIGIAVAENLTQSGHGFCSQKQSDGITQASIFRIAKDSSKIDPETLRLLLMAQPGATEQRIQSVKRSVQVQVAHA